MLRFRSIVWMLGAQFQYGLSVSSVKVVRHNFGEYFRGLWKTESEANEPSGPYDISGSANGDSEKWGTSRLSLGFCQVSPRFP